MLAPVNCARPTTAGPVRAVAVPDWFGLLGVSGFVAALLLSQPYVRHRGLQDLARRA